jgi:hypothetical protein
VEVHEGLLAEFDVVDRAEADRAAVDFPDEVVGLALRRRPGEVLRVVDAPGIATRHPLAVGPQLLQVLVGGVVEVVDADIDLLQLHRPDDHDRARLLRPRHRCRPD